jgi:arylsulfatase A-like enzyme
MTMDIFPTVCRAAGAKFSHEIDGREYLSELLGQEQNRDERFLFWVRREGGPRGGQAYYAARYGKWKILQNSPFEPLKLYDLEADPREQKPLSEKHPAYNKLFNALRNHIIRAGAVPWRKKPVELEPDVWGD